MGTYEILMVTFTGLIAAAAWYAARIEFRREIGSRIESRAVEQRAWESEIESRRATESDILMRIAEIWDSEDFIKARQLVGKHEDNLQEVIQKYEKENQEEYFLITKVANYFENVGVLIDRGYLPRDLVMDLFGDSAGYYYELYQNYITVSRQRGDTDLYEHFERLATR